MRFSVGLRTCGVVLEIPYRNYFFTKSLYRGGIRTCGVVRRLRANRMSVGGSILYFQQMVLKSLQDAWLKLLVAKTTKCIFVRIKLTLVVLLFDCSQLRKTKRVRRTIFYVGRGQTILPRTYCIKLKREEDWNNVFE